MKKLILISALSCLLLSGCGGNHAETTTPSTGTMAPSSPTVTVPETTTPTVGTTVPTVPTTQPQDTTFEVYYPDESYVALLHKSIAVEELTAEAVLQELMDLGVVNSSVIVRDVFLDGTQLNLDLSVDFLEQLRTLGSTGERYVVGSVVNTFLSAYGAETVMITIDGDLMDSGHAVYDAPMEFFS